MNREREGQKKKVAMAMASSTSGQPQFIASTGNRSSANAPLIENSDTDQIVVPDVSSFLFFQKKKKLLKFNKALGFIIIFSFILSLFYFIFLKKLLT